MNPRSLPGQKSEGRPLGRPFFAHSARKPYGNKMDSERKMARRLPTVIEQLETNKASSLLLALQRAEATAVQPWTKAQRRRALIFLAGNRRQQI